MTQNNLGNAYKYLPSEDRSANLVRAIGYYESALRVRTEDRFPQDWAKTQGNIGMTYRDWAGIENRDENRIRAIEHLTNAIRGFRACGDEHGRIKCEKMLARWKAEWGMD
jgi:hypothetical protein